MAKKGDRWAALEPIRQGVRTHMDGFAPKIALGLGLRHDWGPQYTAHQFQGELAWLRDTIDAFLRRKTRMQRCRRALHADPEGGMPVSSTTSRASRRPGK